MQGRHRLSVRDRRDAGVVYQEIEPAELFHGVINHGLGILHLGRVGFEGKDRSAVLLEILRHTLQTFEITGGDHQVASGLG